MRLLCADDHYNRSWPRVFVGEYGAANGPTVRTLRAALGEALFLLGLERNCDVVVASSFAPLLGNSNGNTSQPCCGNRHNLVQFNASSLFAMPSFYAQRMLRDSLGTHTLATARVGGSGSWGAQASIVAPSPSSSPSSALSSSGTNVTIKLVNYTPNPQNISVSLEGWNSSCSIGQVMATVLSDDDPFVENTLEQPSRVVPRDFSAGVTIGGGGQSVELAMPAWSLVVTHVVIR
jgi:alpha-N-arabinofuranosidase